MTIKRKGFVLPTVMFSVAVMSIVVVAAINTASDERRSSRATREATLALYAAEGGLRQVYGSWPSAAVKALNPGDSLVLGWSTLPNNASYRTVIHRVDRQGLQVYNVVVQGRRTGISGGVATIVGVVGGIPKMTYGVFTKNNTNLSNGLVDSYDSEVSSYNAATADSNATIWANGSVSLNNIPIKGDVGATGAVVLGGTSTATGDVTPAEDPKPEMPIEPCPAGGFTPAAALPPLSSTNNYTYNQATGVLAIMNPSTIFNLTGTNYYFSSVTINGNANLTVNPPAGQRTEIVISNLLNIAGGSVTNVPGTAMALGFSSCGSPLVPATWSISGGTHAAYSVYAPNHPVTFSSNNGDLKGAVVASTFTMSGGARLHYDEALARLPSKELIVQRGTWSMFPGN